MLNSKKFFSGISDRIPNRSLVLARALNDSRVESLARSLNLNLQDPVTVANLLKRAKQTLESSSQVSLGTAVVAMDPTPETDVTLIENTHVLTALRTYRAIETMR